MDAKRSSAEGKASGRRLACGAELVLTASALAVAPAAASDDESLVYTISGDITTLNDAAFTAPTPP